MLVLVLAASGPASDTNLGHAYLRVVEAWSGRSRSCHSWLLENVASGQPLTQLTHGHELEEAARCVVPPLEHSSPHSFKPRPHPLPPGLT